MVNNFVTNEKEKELKNEIRKAGKAVIAFSGGVDSSYLAYIANLELGVDAVCVTGLSPSVSRVQRSQAGNFALIHGLNHLSLDTEELSDLNYAANPVNRCYFCKSELYKKLRGLAAEAGIAVIFDGANADDLLDHRPGSLAAKKNNVGSPLADLGFTKHEIRERSRFHGLDTWEMPASPCLASRIQYGIPVSISTLSKIEKGEDFLRSLGFREFRVRFHDTLVRLEICLEELPAALDPLLFADISSFFRSQGFKFVTLDMEGFRSGSMNEMPKTGASRPKTSATGI